MFKQIDTFFFNISRSAQEIYSILNISHNDYFKYRDMILTVYALFVKRYRLKENENLIWLIAKLIYLKEKVIIRSIANRYYFQKMAE